MIVLWQMVAFVSLWWITNEINTIAAKFMMKAGEVAGEKVDASICGVTPAFKDLRWLELTTIQHLFGAVASVILLNALIGRSTPIWPRDSPKVTVCVAILANVVGSLASNLTYALSGSSVANAVMSCEPIFIFFFCFCLYDNHKNLNHSTLVSIMTMIAGTCTVVVVSSSVNVWSIFAALFSNIGFAIRTICLKKMIWKSTFQKYAVVSIGSVVLLVPVTILKLVALSTHTNSTIFSSSVISSVFHFIYNTASITVLQDVSPLTHAVLNLSRRVCVVVANLLYFHTPLSLTLIIGLVIFILGVALYGHYKNTNNLTKHFGHRLFYIWIVACVLCVLSLNLSSLSSAITHTTILQSRSNVHVKQPSTKVEIQSLNTLYLEESKQLIVTAWAFERDIPQIALQNIENLQAMNPHGHVHVYCGTSQCIQTILSLKGFNMTTEFLVISELVKDTPLEQWLGRHPLNKVLAGLEFEEHLQIVTQLAILWQHRGIYVNPMVTLTDNTSLPSCQSGWVGTSEIISILDISCFPSYHPLIQSIMEEFVHHYPKHANGTSIFHFSFKNVLDNAYNSYCQPNVDCLVNSNLNYTITSLSHSTDVRSHYGTLSYDVRVKSIKSANLGDEIQGFPGIQFLPFVDQFLERDNFNKLSTKEPVTIFFNAWWGASSMTWPPPSNIHPIMASLHVRNVVIRKWAKSIDFLKANSPVGCRDLGTLGSMRKYNVDAYFSGCLTLMIKNPSVTKERTNKIYFVDVKNETKQLFPEEVIEQGIDIKHNYKNIHSKSLERFTEAFKLIELYATAKLVITRRIHCALPCVAMGIPVIFINSPKMPGGGGSKSGSSPRVIGLTPLFHTIDMYKMSLDEVKKWLHDFDWNNPPPNPNVNMMMRMRATFWNVIRHNEVLYDAAHKFGMIPLHPPPAQASEHHELLFHLLFTTSPEINVGLFGGESMKGAFNWRHWRTVESIFHHHPFARVIIHSNTLQQSEFNVLTEAGYRIEVQMYDLEDLLSDSLAQEFSHQIKIATNGPHWNINIHLTDLLRLLVVYRWGGVYMDADMILIKPVNHLKNTIALQTPSTPMTMNSVFMTFEKENTYIKDCLVDFTNMFSHHDWSWDASGLNLLIRIYNRYAADDSHEMIVNLKQDSFFVFHWSKIKKDCFEVLPESQYDARLKKLQESEAYAVFLNSKITCREGAEDKLKEGTICKHVLNDFCVLCNNRY